MATPAGLNEGEVQQQLKNMVNFILREAEEKANEIRIKADEEYNIEKSRLVQGETMKIMKEYDRKEKQVEVQKKIAFSNQLNQSRLKVLRARDQCVQHIFTKAKQALYEISKPGEPYKKLLRALIVQALIKLMESEVQVRCRPEDESMVQEVLRGATEEFTAKTGKACKATIDRAHYLARGPTSENDAHNSCAGGVVLSAHDGHILCNNTLDTRLNLALELSLPEVRKTLFTNLVPLTRMFAGSGR